MGLREDAQARMWAHAKERAEDGEEACGIVSLTTWRVIPLRNVANDPRHYYSADEDDLRAAFDTLDGEPFAVYHSHVETAALPSEGDMDGATYPDQYILAVTTGKLRRFSVLPDRTWTIVHEEEMMK